MKYWHVMKDDGWTRIISQQRPYGKLVHLIAPDCYNKLCGRNSRNVFRDSRLHHDYT